MTKPKISSLELLDATAKHLFFKPYMWLDATETQEVDSAINHVFDNHKGQVVTLKQFLSYTEDSIKNG